jgi:ectoine hydroxylase-related dioxygenase (phytanoyl-CoA dioxygenase family)
MDKLYTRTIQNDDKAVKIMGDNRTKRFNNAVCESETFRRTIIEKDLVHKMSDAALNQHSGTGYWLSSTQVIELEPGAPAQFLHRDQEMIRFWNSLGPSAPEAMMNCFVALTPFTEANGATRLVLGSHRWPNFVGCREPGFEGYEGVESVPLEMDTGDCFFMSAKLLHGGGHNSTTTEKRRGLSITLIRHDLTPYQAYAVTTPLDIVASLSFRAQGLYGFRSPHWAEDNWCYSSWAADEVDVGTRLGLPTNGYKN